MNRRQESENQSVWDRVLAADTASFEQVVKANQRAVMAVAYSLLGDFNAAQDVSQETFLVAWKSRAQLRRGDRLSAWLCGIARNLARQWLRRNRRMSALSASAEAQLAEFPTPDSEPSITPDDAALVWKSLEQIPVPYREAIVLYYQQRQSVAEVAAALGISEATARQRLSRGRAKLRDQVATVVAGVLERAKPKSRFTSKVMAGIAAMGTSTMGGGQLTAATASTSLRVLASGTSKTLSTGAFGGMLGGAAGAVGGLFGAWLGVWVPSQLAQTKSESDLLRLQGKVIMRWAIVFTLLTLLLTGSFVWLRYSPWIFVAVLMLSSLLFTGWSIAFSLRTNQLVRKIRNEFDPRTDPNPSRLRTALRDLASSWQGQRYRSRARLLGWPLVDIQVSDPPVGCGASRDRIPLTAKGWIAIGDRAIGILFAAGGRACGGVAVGGCTCGVVSMGGVAVGLVAAGGLTVGGLALGGVAVAGIAAAGLAVGWYAAGGLAIAWKAAVGGAAIAWEFAGGGLALARQMAYGGAASARDANTDHTRQLFEQHWLTEGLQVLLDHQWALLGASIALVLLSLAGSRLLYRRVDVGSPPAKDAS